MTTDEIYAKLLYFKHGETEQFWKKEPMIPFDNDYITLIRVDSSNKAGGSSVKQGKQWSLIIDLKRSIIGFDTWRRLKSKMGDELTITRVTKGENIGKYGIRLYQMSKNPTPEIVDELLKYIFD